MAMEYKEGFKWVELACQALLSHFGPVYLLRVSKNDDEKRCFLK